MPVDPKLLEIIRCPVTKNQVSVVKPELLEKINLKIRAGEACYADGSVVDSELEEGLITSTGTTIYRVDSSIPIMLEEKSIPISEIE